MANSTLTIYHENLPVSQRYYEGIIRQIKQVYQVKKIVSPPIDDVATLLISNYTHQPRMVLTNHRINANLLRPVLLDGICLKNNNLVLVMYQPSSFISTLYLMLHELGHFFGLPHCRNHKCIMGLSSMENGLSYSWKRLASANRIPTRRILCGSCTGLLRTSHSR